MDTLNQFIASTTDARELKRALAVQMRQQGYPYQQIESLLLVSQSFIGKWQQLYRLLALMDSNWDSGVRKAI